MFETTHLGLLVMRRLGTLAIQNYQYHILKKFVIGLESHAKGGNQEPKLTNQSLIDLTQTEMTLIQCSFSFLPIGNSKLYPSRTSFTTCDSSKSGETFHSITLRSFSLRFIIFGHFPVDGIPSDREMKTATIDRSVLSTLLVWVLHFH